MTKIENELEFKDYMEQNGPNKKGSQSNYISWLNFISESGFNINTELKENEQIIAFLKENEHLRTKYKSKDAYADFGSALNKYRKFINSEFGTITFDFKKISQEEISETQKKILINARVGQGKFRKDLIHLWNKCSVSGAKRKELLIASHILPWRKASNTERLDKYNGLLLTPNYDKLFDKGLISFKDNGAIIISVKLNLSEYDKFGINSNDKLNCIHDENIKYLKKHREFFNMILNEE